MIYFCIFTSKIWISNGGLADVLTVFARTEYTDDQVGYSHKYMHYNLNHGKLECTVGKKL